MRVLPNDRRVSRLGISVGKRHGGAVRRNRIRRVLRAAYRLNKEAVGGRFDIVVLPRPTRKEITLESMTPALREALQKISEAFAGA
jgi:ribonuclease P protein component